MGARFWAGYDVGFNLGYRYMFGLQDVLLLMLVMVLGSYAWSAQGVREKALHAARLYCKQQELQLLDESVALRAVWWKRDRDGRWRFWRSYQFEFAATGDERYVGKVITLGKKIENIWTPPHRVPDSRDQLH